MSRRRSIVPLALLLAAALASSGAAGARSSEAPSRLLVTAAEWSMTLSRAELGPGPAIIQMYNRGEDPHNLRIQKRGGGPIRRIADVEPGEVGALELRLEKRTRYRLWCSLAGHRELGMRARLKVAGRRHSSR